MLLEQSKQTYCRDRFGFWAEWHDGMLWLVVPAGTDPDDGLPLQHRRLAAAPEVHWWREGQYARIADVLRAQGQPVKSPRPWWKRLLGR